MEPVTITPVKMQEFVAKAMAYRSVGDPHARDRNGAPRWTWFSDEAADFVRNYWYLLQESDQ